MKNIIEELDNFEKESNIDLFIESKANHAIVAAINVIKLIQESYNPELTEKLTRRLLSSIKSRDPRKFHRKIRQIREARGK